MTPIEFVIPQRPVSQQARRQARLREWKEFVAEHARLAVNEPRELASEPVALKLLYVYEEAALDIDNILKPIQDALIGVLLEDDSVITDVEIVEDGSGLRSPSTRYLRHSRQVWRSVENSSGLR
jgi:crossover junction endodeoxyribonuclease RusA